MTHYFPVFSDENLKEILKSKGYEDKFLKILRDIKAKQGGTYPAQLMYQEVEMCKNAVLKIQSANVS